MWFGVCVCVCVCVRMSLCLWVGGCECVGLYVWARVYEWCESVCICGCV